MSKPFTKEYFWTRIKITDLLGCWNWQYSGTQKGYGRVKAWGKSRLAHRVAWELTYGDIPKDMNVLHKCDNPPCCNPNHLFLGTQKDNMADCRAKGRRGDKLSEADVRTIRAMGKEGLLHKDIATKFGVHRAHITTILNGRTWRHV